MFRINALDKRFFYLISFLSLIVMILLSYNAPLSGDEEVHFEQAEKNLQYFKTLGRDKTALDTPISRLKYYGQAFDNLTTLLIKLFRVDNIYRFRHLSNAVVTWLLMLVSGLFAYRLSKNYWTAALAVLLLLCSPRFVGHGMNNLKDIPFAFGYMMGLYFMLKALIEFPKVRRINYILLAIGIAISIGIRIGGLLLICYLWLFFALVIYQYLLNNRPDRGAAVRLIVKYFFLLMTVSVFAYAGGLLLWPFAWENPITHPVAALQLMHDYPTTVRQIYEGKLFWSEQFPWYYAIKYIGISIPMAVLVGMCVYLYYSWRIAKEHNPLWYIFVIITLAFPIYYSALSGANLYGGWRQLLFVYPPMIVLSSVGLVVWIQSQRMKLMQYVLLVISAGLLFGPVSHMIRNHPHHYVYFNELVGGYSKAYGNYEGDYYFTSYREAYRWLFARMDALGQQGPVVVANNFPLQWYVASGNSNVSSISIDYFRRGEYDWDYAVFCNTFLPPFQLKNGIWPPSNTVHQVMVDDRPICAILSRPTKADYSGSLALDSGNYAVAADKFNEALRLDPGNESALLNFSIARWKAGDTNGAEELLDQLTQLYPRYEWVWEIRGEMSLEQKDYVRALDFFQSNLDYNYKFFHSYVNIARVYRIRGEYDQAIKALKKCIWLNPFYKPALLEAGGLYSEIGKSELSVRFFDRANHLN